ncbi:hypothetical protein QQ045_008284 [Rhodiola kirilowii]
MGKRKERRRAALSTAGRRVKLDLFAEPSGELGGSSVNENGVRDTDSKPSTGSPKPLSSGGFRQFSSKEFVGRHECSASLCWWKCKKLQDMLRCLFYKFDPIL